MTYRSRFTLTALTLVAASAFAPVAQASGFQLREQSASAQGNGFAGVSATGSDISVAFFNPALLTQFSGWQFSGGITQVAAKAEFSDGVATRFDGSVISGATSHKNIAPAGLVPNLTMMYSVSDDFKLGFGINAPFGLPTEYDSTWAGRYHALKTDLKVVDLAPTIAYRFNKQWSMGLSAVARRSEATLSNAVDFGLLAGLTPGSQDGKATVTGKTWSYGIRAGLTFQPTDALRFGLAYQGAQTPKVKGTVDFEYPSTLTGAALATVQARGFKDGAASAEVTLPATYSLGFNYDVSPAFSIQGEIARSTWSSFEELIVKFEDNAAPQATQTVTQEQWKNTTFMSLGFTWKTSDAWTIKAGLSRDDGAVTDAYRTPRIPDDNRTWISMGVGYNFSKATRVDVSYSHLFIPDQQVNLHTAPVSTDENFTRGNLSGKFTSEINILGIGLSHKF